MQSENPLLESIKLCRECDDLSGFVRLIKKYLRTAQSQNTDQVENYWFLIERLDNQPQIRWEEKLNPREKIPGV